MTTKSQNIPPDIRVQAGVPNGDQRRDNRQMLVGALNERGEIRIRLDAYIYDPVLRRYSPMRGGTLTALCRSTEAAELVVKKVSEAVREMDGAKLNGGGR
jgi:hypothetical protein